MTEGRLPRCTRWSPERPFTGVTRPSSMSSRPIWRELCLLRTSQPAERFRLVAIQRKAHPPFDVPCCTRSLSLASKFTGNAAPPTTITSPKFPQNSWGVRSSSEFPSPSSISGAETGGPREVSRESRATRGDAVVRSKSRGAHARGIGRRDAHSGI